MSYIAFFQISRSTNIRDWVHDPNLFCIGKVVAYNSSDEIFPDLPNELFHLVEDIEESLITTHQIEAYNKFLSLNNIQTEDITKTYIVYNMNFNITNIPIAMPIFERTN